MADSNLDYLGITGSDVMTTPVATTPKLGIEEAHELLWSSMSQPRLNYVMVLSVYKELLNEVDFYAVANEFVGRSEHRLLSV